MRPTTGLTFGGRYELESRIAIGGMGEVWKATDLVIGRTVAIKILKDEYLGDPGFLERFRAEARHAALVNHEGIANVFDYGEEDGSAFLVMELVPGEALSTILERDHVLPTDKVLDIVAQTAAALHAAHAAGLVHRDIKPGNLLITPDGRVKITDFGIARIADQVPLTATGQVMGTVQYLSPEQASGKPASPTTDIYSLGIVAYEALAGRRPFIGESQVAIAMAQINETAADLPTTVSEPVRNLVFACIAKNPADRPASSAHLSRAASALRRGDLQAAAAAVPAILAGVTPTAATTMLMPSAGATQATTVMPTPPPLTRAESMAATAEPQKRKRSPWTWPLIALFLLLAIVTTGALIALFNQQDEPPAASPTATSATPTPTPTTATPTPTETSNRVNLAESDVVGLPIADARAKLAELELVASEEPGNAAETEDQVGIVYYVNPTGPVEKGSTITLRAYGAVPVPEPETPATPTAAPTANPRENVAPGTQVRLTWPAQSCPTGQTLTAYNVILEGATLASQGSATATEATVTMGATQFTASYSYTCGETESEASPSVTVTPPTAG